MKHKDGFYPYTGYYDSINILIEQIRAFFNFFKNELDLDNGLNLRFENFNKIRISDIEIRTEFDNSGYIMSIIGCYSNTPFYRNELYYWFYDDNKKRDIPKKYFDIKYQISQVNNYKAKASFQIIRRIISDSNFIVYFEQELDKLYINLMQEYINFAKPKLRSMIEDSIILPFITLYRRRIDEKDIEQINKLFKTPPFLIYSDIDYEQTSWGYKPGEGRYYDDNFIYKYSVEICDENLLKDKDFIELKKFIEDFSKTDTERSSDRGYSAAEYKKRLYCKEIDYNLSFKFNKEFFSGYPFYINKFYSFLPGSKDYESLYDNDYYFELYIKLFFVFFEIEDIFQFLLNNKEHKYIEDLTVEFNCLFNIYEFIFSRGRKTKVIGEGSTFEININQTFSGYKEKIIKMVQNKFSCDVDVALSNYFVNRESKNLTQKNDLTNLYHYFKNYLK